MNSQSRMPTQADVARLAGVSTATVSRVVNNRGVITPDVRQRVLESIDSLNYIPHAGARALAMQRTGTLGAIIPSLNNAIFAEGINAFEHTAQKLGYTLILSVSQQDPEREQALVTKMIERGVDGLLLVGNHHDETVFDQLERAGVRHVCTWAHDAQSRAPNVGFDNATAMHAVVDHLVEHGHRKIAMLAGITKHNDRAADRIKGAQHRMKTHGLSLPDRRVFQVPYSIRESRQAFWSAIDSDISALICGNDVIAFGALLEAQKTGLRVPDDLSITGFDDLSLSAEMSPALTTVQVGAAAMGDVAARRLVAAVEGRSVVVSAKLDTTLVVRETTGPCTTLDVH